MTSRAGPCWPDRHRLGGSSINAAREDTLCFTPLNLSLKGHSIRATRADIAPISRLVKGAPWVRVQVMSGGSGPAGVAASLRHVGHERRLRIERDTGDSAMSRAQLRALVKSWNLDLVRWCYRNRE